MDVNQLKSRQFENKRSDETFNDKPVKRILLWKCTGHTKDVFRIMTSLENSLYRRGARVMTIAYTNIVCKIIMIAIIVRRINMKIEYISFVFYFFNTFNLHNFYQSLY